MFIKKLKQTNSGKLVKKARKITIFVFHNQVSTVILSFKDKHNRITQEYIADFPKTEIKAFEDNNKNKTDSYYIEVNIMPFEAKIYSYE